jgi:tRNA-2-methylthio-N6-dimethylallyladenosine synthase
MAVLLADCGYEQTEDSAKADCLLINTCSIRDKAEQKAFSELGRLMKLKKKNPDLIVGFAGCLAQHLGARIHSRVKNVDLVFGTHNIHRLPEMMEAVQKERKPVTEVGFSSSLHSLGIYARPATGRLAPMSPLCRGVTTIAPIASFRICAGRKKAGRRRTSSGKLKSWRGPASGK